MTPSQNVLDAFELTEIPLPLTGGEGTSYRCGDCVLKPVANQEEAESIAGMLSILKVDGLRVNKPRKTVNGTWTHDGWVAYAYLEGQESKGNVLEKLRVAERLHQGLRDIPAPEFIGKRNHVWEVADNAVWDTTGLSFDDAIQPDLDALMGQLKPVKITSQLIHGDLTGNILFHPEYPPAVIDFSLYWRPADYAKAIIIVDSIVWDDAPLTLLDAIDNTGDMQQFLIRALLWRIKTSELFYKQHQHAVDDIVKPYKPLINATLSRKRA